MWSSALYGIGVGDGEIVVVALSQLDNVGGQPYWSWYGFNSRVADAAPMVYVNDTLYIQSSDQKGYPEQEDGFVYLGKILSDVTNYQGDGADGIPKENFQANDPIIGCEVYQYGENIVVKINGSYWLYMKYGEPEITWDDLTEQEKADLDHRDLPGRIHPPK